MVSIVQSKGLKLGILGFMLICFLIPLKLVENVLNERMARSNEAIQEISSKWGESKLIAGPFLVIPYEAQVSKYIDGQTNKLEVETVYKELFILPDDLTINGNVNTSIRSRGIFDAVLYRADIQISGSFSDAYALLGKQSPSNIYWDQAYLSVYISDNKGISEEVNIVWNKKKMQFLPGSGSSAFKSGIHTIESINPKSANNFSMDLKINGSQSISFLPIGKSSKTQITSNWSDPSFFGSVLPMERNITKTGFTSSWNSSYFSRNYDQILYDGNEFATKEIFNSSYGVNFIIPLDHYQQVERSLKYAILILLSCFTVFFLIETLNRLRLHPIQYLLMGAAMVVFYILNLSFSEHLGFSISYFIASLAIATLVGYYAGFILESKIKGVQCFSYFLFLFGFLYIILSAQDYALLLGSIAIFFLLAFVMHTTRKLDWSNSDSKLTRD
jgi:inner membrane protein